MINYFLENGADPNFKNYEDKSPFYKFTHSLCNLNLNNEFG